MGLKRAMIAGLFWTGIASGHCAICYRTAEALGAARGRVLNSGILVLATPPILLLAGFAIVLVRRRD
jgi:hypothetical protein